VHLHVSHNPTVSRLHIETHVSYMSVLSSSLLMYSSRILVSMFVGSKELLIS